MDGWIVGCPGERLGIVVVFRCIESGVPDVRVVTTIVFQYGHFGHFGTKSLWPDDQDWSAEIKTAIGYGPAKQLVAETPQFGLKLGTAEKAHIGVTVAVLSARVDKVAVGVDFVL